MKARIVTLNIFFFIIDTFRVVGHVREASKYKIICSSLHSVRYRDHFALGELRWSALDGRSRALAVHVLGRLLELERKRIMESKISSTMIAIS